MTKTEVITGYKKGAIMKKMPQFYGVATVGARGQIVVPSKVRKMLNIKSGDSLMVMSGHPGGKKMIKLIPVNEFSKIINHFEQHISEMKAQINKKGIDIE